MAVLPPEVILLILSYIPSLPFHSYKSPALRALAACTTVSRSWYPLARQVLFTFPLLLESDLSPFRQTVLNSPAHATSVRSLEIIPIGRDLLLLAQLICNLPNLRELYISRIGSSTTLEPESISFLKSGPPIRSFHIYAPSSIVLAFISTWPSLQFLHVTTDLIANFSIINRLPPLPPFSLYQLHWSADPVNFFSELRDAEWALSNSFSTLNILELNMTISTAFFRRLVTHPQCTLRSLRLSDITSDYIPLLPLITQLEELVILSGSFDGDFPDVSSSIQHLSIPFPAFRGRLELFENFFDTHPSLRVWTIHELRWCDRNEGEKLRKMIMDYNLEARLYRIYPKERSMVCLSLSSQTVLLIILKNEKMEPVTSFPRSSYFGDYDERRMTLDELLSDYEVSLIKHNVDR
jgi:hypothetical protein